MVGVKLVVGYLSVVVAAPRVERNAGGVVQVGDQGCAREALKQSMSCLRSSSILLIPRHAVGPFSS